MTATIKRKNPSLQIISYLLDIDCFYELDELDTVFDYH